MPVARIEIDGRIARVEVPEGTSPEEAERIARQQIMEMNQPVSTKQYHQALRDTLIDNTKDVAGEFAAGANEAMMFVPDTAVDALNVIKGGYKGLGKLATGQGLDAAVAATRERPIPTPSDLIEKGLGHRPGEGGFMEPGLTRDMVRGGGQLAGAAMQMKPVFGRNVATPRGAAEELAGFGSATPAGAGTQLDQLPTPNKRLERELAVKRRAGDVASVGYKSDELGNVVKDAAQVQAIKTGVDEGAVALISSSSKPTRKRMRDMLTIVEDGIKNKRYRDANRPNKVIGKSLRDRLSAVMAENKRSGRSIDRIAKQKLKGEAVDIRGPMHRFSNDLAEEDIIFNPKTGEIDFTNATIEGMDDLEGLMRRVIGRLHDTKTPTAYDVHRAKRFLDRQVSYGRSQSGMDATMAGIIKRLRRGLDGVLDSKFPEYDAANKSYAETIGLINDMQSLAGTKTNLLGDNVDRALGIMSRKVLSNYGTSTMMGDTFSALDDVSRKYGAFDDNLMDMISYESELRRLFPEAVPPNTLQGNVGMETGRAAMDIVTGNKAGLIGKGFNMVSNTLKRSKEDHIKALKELLRD